MAKRFKDEIKEEIRDEVADIIYEKAKSDVKNRVKAIYYKWKDKIISFLGIGETQEQKIRRISEEIKRDQNVLLSDSALGIFELFTVKFGSSIVDMIGVHNIEEPKQLENKNNNSNDNEREDNE